MSGKVSIPPRAYLWRYLVQTTTWLDDHPLKAAALIGTAIAGGMTWVYFESKTNLISPAAPRDVYYHIKPADPATPSESPKNESVCITQGQIHFRDHVWDKRNYERNWSVLARDKQQQQDHYWYRAERSRDDDYLRNSGNSFN